MQRKFTVGWLLLSLLMAGGLLTGRTGLAQQLPPDLLIDETFQHPPKGYYWEGRTANLEGQLTPAGYAFRSLGNAFSNMPVDPLGPALNQERDFVIEGELRGTGNIGLYWGGQGAGAGIEFTVAQLNLSLGSPIVAVLRLQGGTWDRLAAVPLPTQAAPADWHTIRIARTGATVTYSVDGSPVLAQPWPTPPGRHLGLTMAPGGAVTLRRLRIWHHHGLRLAPGVPAGLRRERLATPGLNTEREENAPLVSADGRYLYFSRAMGSADSIDSPTAYDADVFVARRDAAGEWGPARSVGAPINAPATTNYPLYVAPDGQTLLVSGRYAPDGRMTGRGFSRTQRRPDGTWTMPEPLPEATGTRPDFAPRNATSCLDASGTVLLLSAVLATNLTNADLYLCRRQPDGTWSTPVRLPAPINTSGNESTPFLAPDGKSLYFSSDTHPGYGGFDVFVSTRLDDTWTRWSEPLNLGPAVNTARAELYYSTVAAGDYAYLVSDGGTGQRADIYRLKLPPTLKPDPTLLVRGRVLDALTRQPIATAEVRYEQLPTGTEAGVVLPAVAGSFEATLPAGQLYGLRATAPGYLSVNESLDLTAATAYREVTQDLLLMPLAPPLGAASVRLAVPGGVLARPLPGRLATLPRQAVIEDKIILNNLFFIRGKAVLLPASFPELNRLAETLTENPSLAIRLDGHTDNTGDAKDPNPNQVLSEQRAQAVQAYLLAHGIAASRLGTGGYGGSRPVAPNDTEMHKQQNRRVECVIVSR